MAREPQWIDVGAADELKKTELQPVSAGTTRVALSFRDGEFGAVSNACNHVGGPLGEGRIDKAGYIQCPWHGWKFHCRTGLGEPGFEDDKVPAFPVKVENGSRAGRHRQSDQTPQEAPRAASRSRAIRSARPARCALAGISTTNMNKELPRFSGSDHLLDHALARGEETRRRDQANPPEDLKFRHCEGYFSKSLRACTWPCSITQMDPNDQLDQVYEVLVHWADAIIVATPIRWGTASSLYFKMVERLNCVQVDVATKEQQLIMNKVAGFIIVGGQDNVQQVAGQMLSFFGELGFLFPKFPYIAHSRGWSHEDMENNVRIVRESKALARGAAALAERCLEMAGKLVAAGEQPSMAERGGLKGRPVMAGIDHD